mmetsp:Transcript_16823/g.32816  ORF Transcript_16823/g.32816 Transcript_16823/m.32816 type:complete len:633 (+) Transcript_16823:352-2250(+)|eukprot:CAMPEP_0171586684 /NCGR_PEP_ID=MMETSP0961-20121227/12754_1 /TAXON_ID=87120 /ORGANISM="Aurantiochytrium limacinum, Strain ATCCMYA-1381" /LENGTH=632 /DNA_ID=CAMNT_0012144547 /DNA_START=306 /DNA_END=2204 /DNA_ORIENTATION=-
MPRTRRAARQEAAVRLAENPADSHDDLLFQAKITSPAVLKAASAAAKTRATRATKSRIQSATSGMASAFKSPGKVKPNKAKSKAPVQKSVIESTTSMASPPPSQVKAERLRSTLPSTPERKPSTSQVMSTPERKFGSPSTTSSSFQSPEQSRIRKSLVGSGTPLHASPIAPGRKKNLTASAMKGTALGQKQESHGSSSPSGKERIANVEKANTVQTQARRLSEVFSSSKPREAVTTTSNSAPTAAQDEYQELDRKIHLKMLYSLIRRKTGALGGGGSGGAIYGEVTQESFQRVVDVLVSKCGLNTESVFLDIGAGLGKPNFHVAISPGVKQSFGVELIGGRWWQSIYLLDQCLGECTLRSYAQKCFFAHANVTDMADFEPITHVYSFNRGFPPEAMKAVAQAFHASSSSLYFICFDKPKILEEYGFELDLVDFVPTKMAGSGEQHRCYIYRRTDMPEAFSSSSAGQQEESKVDSAESSSESEEEETKDDKSVDQQVARTQPKRRGKAAKVPALFTLARTPIRTRGSRGRKATASSEDIRAALDFDSLKEEKEEKVQVKITKTKMVSSSSFTLVAPPTEVEYAPHVPHADSYMSGLDLMSSSAMVYQSWVRDQVGLHRSDRSSRSSTRRQLRH